MSVLVVDASIAAAWLLPDESDARADAAYAIVEASGDVGFVTQHWHFEVRNALLRAERRGRATAYQVDMRLIRLTQITELLQTDTTPNFDSAFSLARAHGLSFYDATYLELAIRRQAPLATLDAALERAAAAEGLSLL